jgi:PTH1 family peptidyl-tRNA hydrolase
MVAVFFILEDIYDMTEGIRCIVGLGNPGPQYAATRHNVGFWFIDTLARQHDVVLRPDSKFFSDLGKLNLATGSCWLLKPNTFMNHSGRAVSALSNFYKLSPEQILVVHDELDLPGGTIRLKKGGGHGGHNGLRDIISALGSRDFYRLRLGIDHPGHRSQVTSYVLSRPSRSDQDNIEDTINTAGNLVCDLIAGHYQHLMNKLHTEKK